MEQIGVLALQTEAHHFCGFFLNIGGSFWIQVLAVGYYEHSFLLW
ncbi:hypothetical protein [Aliivibrio finisterrensis]|nr:hypothetical protein [Aliivibrio finisterrensis]